MDKPRIFLGSSVLQAKLLQARGLEDAEVRDGPMPTNPATGLPSDSSPRLVHDLHLFVVHSAAVYRDFGQGFLDHRKIRGRQLNVGCLQILVMVIHVSRTGDWNNPWLLRKEPRQYDLRGRRVLCARETFQPVD